VTLINAALGSEPGKVKFISEGSDAGRLIMRSDKVESSIEVNSELLSNYINDKVDLLKLDIEGAEFEVLSEVKDKLHLIENIFIEFHSFINQESKLDDILRILKVNGFSTYVNAPGVTSRQPFINRPNKHGMEMQLNIYGFRR
jgi:hypothetical protein